MCRIILPSSLYSYLPISKIDIQRENWSLTVNWMRDTDEMEGKSKWEFESERQWDQHSRKTHNHFWHKIEVCVSVCICTNIQYLLTQQSVLNLAECCLMFTLQFSHRIVWWIAVSGLCVLELLLKHDIIKCTWKFQKCVRSQHTRSHIHFFSVQYLHHP